jgi:hypothetical protein
MAMTGYLEVWTSPWFEGFMPGMSCGEMKCAGGDFTHLRIEEELGEAYKDGRRHRVVTLREHRTAEDWRKEWTAAYGTLG